MHAPVKIVLLLGIPVRVSQDDVAHFYKVFGHQDVDDLNSEAVMENESLDLARQLACNAVDVERTLIVGKRQDRVIIVSRLSNHFTGDCAIEEDKVRSGR